MDNDIVPGLLADIHKQFYLETTQSKKLKAALLKLEKNKATYQDVNEFAIEVGETLSKVLSDNIYSEILPDRKMYYNIAQRILDPTLKNNYDLISGYAADVQKSLNQAANLNLKAQVPEYNQDRTNGIINRVSSEDNFDDIKWILDDPIVNFSQSIVDDSIKSNCEFQAKAGLKPKLIRRVSGHGCAWCRNLAGSYDYGDAPEDIYRRHDNCRCTVDFRPGDGRRNIVHSGREGERKYVKDKYGSYTLSKNERIKRSKERQKTSEQRKAAAREKRIKTWQNKRTAKLAQHDKNDKIELRKELNRKVSVEIDELTNCLRDTKTGHLVETDYQKTVISKTKAVSLQKRGWNFDWSDTSGQVYQLTLKGSKEIQGLVSFKKEPGFNFLDLVESAPKNIGHNKRYAGVGPHLFAIAARDSMNNGNDGYVSFLPKTMIREHYREKLHAQDLPNGNMYLDTRASQILIDKYFGKE